MAVDLKSESHDMNQSLLDSTMSDMRVAAEKGRGKLRNFSAYVDTSPMDRHARPHQESMVTLDGKDPRRCSTM